MREIKFRGKSGELGVYGYLTGDDEIHTNEFVDGNRVVYAVDKQSVGQFTNLLDKNGKEIYEGDIILTDDESDGGKPIKTYRTVSFGNGAFYTHTEFSVNENYLPIVATGGEVVGNIYENGSLLDK